MNVLILLLMEQRWNILIISKDEEFCVLILLLMEQRWNVSLLLRYQQMFIVLILLLMEQRWNAKKVALLTIKKVLILLLMEQRWNFQENVTRYFRNCLDPSSNGIALEQSQILMISGLVLKLDFSYPSYFQLFIYTISLFSQMPIVFLSKCRNFVIC